MPSPFLGESPDFFLWGYIENVVFAERPTTREDLMERIQSACAAISRETFLKTVDGFKDVYVCVFEPMERTSNSYSLADCNTGKNGERQGDSRQESTPKETELTTSTPLFLGNAKSKNKVVFFCN